MLDLVEGGQTWDEIVALAKEVEAAGATIINTGIGWHEARVPTIVTSVPRGASLGHRQAAPRRRRSRSSPPTGSTCPRLAEEILARGDADLVSMARPLLADPDWVNKAAEDRADEINTCIACNQACLDHAFVHKQVAAAWSTRARATRRP